MIMIELTPLEVAVKTVLSQDPLVSPEVRGEAQHYCDCKRVLDFTETVVYVICAFLLHMLALHKPSRSVALLESFEKSREGWRISCQQFLLRSKCPVEMASSVHTVGQFNDWLIEPRFWYIRIITDSIQSVPVSERADIRAFLFIYLDEILPWRAATLQSLNSSCNSSGFSLVTASDNAAVLAKVALLYVRCLVVDYPQVWPDGVTALLESWSKHRTAYHSLAHNSTPTANGHTSPSSSSPYSLEEMIALQKYVTMTQFFLSVLEAFDDEVVMETVSRNQKERNRNMAVKDSLRNGDILLLAEAWSQILSDFGDPNLTRLSKSLSLAGSTDIASRCLRVLAKYVVWLDIQMIANEKFLTAAFELFNRQHNCGPAVMDLLGAIVHKRMDPAQRIIMIHKLKLLDQVLHKSNLNDFSRNENSSSGAADYMTVINCEDPDLYALKLSELLNLIGLQLLESFVELRKGLETLTSSCEDAEQDLRRLGGVQAIGPNPFFTPITTPEFWAQLQQEGWNMLDRLLPKICLVFSHPHPDIAESIEPFLSEFLKQLKHLSLKDNGRPHRPPPAPIGSPLCPLYIPIASLRPILHSLFQITLARVQHPFWFDFTVDDDDDELQETFLQYKKDITLLFKRLYSVDEDTSLTFIREICQRLQSAVSQQIHVNQIEAVLHLVLTAGETYRDISKEIAYFDHPLAESLRFLFSSQELLQHPHPQIRILLFQLVIRYMAFFQNQALSPAEANYSEAVLDLLLGSVRVLTSASSRARYGTVHQSSAVLGHAILTLLRFVKANSTTVARYTEQILQEFVKAKLLEVTPLASLQWPQETTSSQSRDSSNIPPPKAFESPSGFPNESWTFDDQNRCFEICGCLIGSLTTSVSPKDRISCLQRLLDPLLAPFEEFSTIDRTHQTTNVSLHQLSVNDPKSCIDYVSRLLQACANLSKGINACDLFSKLWNRCLHVELTALEHFGLDGKVRFAVILLTRRMIPLLKSSTEIIPYLKTFVPLVFDLTAGAFVKTQGHTIDQEELRQTLASESITEEEYTDATAALAASLQRLSQLNHRNALIPASFSGHREISQLCVLLNFIILTFKEQVAQFLLFDVSGFDESLGSGDSRLHLFIRTFNQIVDYWRLMPSGSPELLREKNEVHRDIFSSLHAIAVNSPSTLLALLEEEISQQPAVTSTLTSLLTWMATGAQPKYFHSLQAATVCIQTWTSFLLYVMGSPQMKEALERVDIEVLLFDKLKLSLLLRGATQLSFLLDMENAQHNKTLQEICTLLRLFSGSLPNTNEATSISSLPHHSKLVARLHLVFLEAIPAHVCSPQDATLVLQAIAEASQARDAKEVLRKWIVLQQLSARTSEESGFG